MVDFKGINQALSEALDIEPIDRSKTEVAVIEEKETLPEPANTDIQKDYDLTRDSYTKIIQKGTEAVAEILEIAKATEHPRNYEAAAALIKSVADATRELMDLHKKKVEIIAIEGGKNPNGVNHTNGGTVIEQQNIIIGTPTEVVRRIRNARKPVEKKEEPKAIDVEYHDEQDDNY